MKRDILNRIELAMQSTVEMDDFIDESRYFIASEISKVLKRYVNPRDDEFLSVGMMAFLEAIKSYKLDRGAFYAYAALIIRRRIIDELRKIKAKTHDDNIIYNDLEMTPQAMDKHLDQEVQMDRIAAIKDFNQELFLFGIDFKVLEKKTPKSSKNKEFYQDIARYIFEDNSLKTSLKKDKTLPVQLLSQVFKVNRKKIERKRAYIIACTLIMDEKYTSINMYVKRR